MNTSTNVFLRKTIENEVSHRITGYSNKHIPLRNVPDTRSCCFPYISLTCEKLLFFTTYVSGIANLKICTFAEATDHKERKKLLVAMLWFITCYTEPVWISLIWFIELNCKHKIQTTAPRWFLSLLFSTWFHWDTSLLPPSDTSGVPGPLLLTLKAWNGEVIFFNWPWLYSQWSIVTLSKQAHVGERKKWIFQNNGKVWIQGIFLDCWDSVRQHCQGTKQQPSGQHTLNTWLWGSYQLSSRISNMLEEPLWRSLIATQPAQW